MLERRTLLELVRGAVAGAALAAGYVIAIRPRLLRRGAARDEVQRWLPGDDRVRRAKMESARAVTIRCAAVEVWPSVVQIGHQRAGWQSYDWIHRLVGVAGSVEGESRSAEQIIPELQDLRLGEEVKIGPDTAYHVVYIDPGRGLVLE